MHTEQELQSWSNPVLKIKDPLKRRWAEIKQTMDTHINGVCPIHLYYARRPLESNNTYALAYRVNNFQPVTKEAFDRTLNSINDLIKNANINLNAPDFILNSTYKIKDVELYNFCISSLTKIRETDSNAVIVVMPLVDIVDEFNVRIKDVDVVYVESHHIEKIDNNYIRFKAGEVEFGEIEHKYYIIVDNGQYILEYPDKDGVYSFIPIAKLSPRQPYIHISSNVVHEGKYTLRLPYLFGSAAWGDKFYGQESDFTVQATRYTYIKEIRAKEKCDEVGYIMQDGVHCSVENPKLLCNKCKGSGFVKDDSPLGTIYVDFDKLTSEGKTVPNVITYAEPPQNALQNSKTIVDSYYNTMCDSLGLVKQNNTNQSALSKEFDYKEKISVVYNIAQDDIRVLKEIYQFIEYIFNQDAEPTTDVYLVGEIGKSSLSELQVMLKQAKDNLAPPNVISAIVVQMMQKMLSEDISDVVINVAKEYDKLFIYGSDEIVTARAQFGSYITNKDVYIHNTIIDVIVKYITDTANMEVETITKYLDDYYTKKFPVVTDLLPI
jgi:hypothetical protein